MTGRKGRIEWLLADRGRPEPLRSLALAYLGGLYLRAQAGEAIARLAADDSFPVSCAPDLDRDGTHFLLSFQQACAGGRLTPELVLELGRILEKHRRPSLQWWAAPPTVQPQERSGHAAPAA
jgi:hypothetical protein